MGGDGLLSKPGGPRHIEMRVPGGVARSGDDWDWDGFYAHVAVAPALETLSRATRGVDPKYVSLTRVDGTSSEHEPNRSRRGRA